MNKRGIQWEFIALLILALVFADLYLMRKYDLLYKAYNDAPFTIENQKKMISGTPSLCE